MINVGLFCSIAIGEVLKFRIVDVREKDFYDLRMTINDKNAVTSVEEEGTNIKKKIQKIINIILYGLMFFFFWLIYMDKI